MATQFISTNKNYKRLYNEPLDPSLVWNDISKLREYLNDPTCYLDMIVGCNGNAYIVVEKNGVKDLKLIGTINSDGTINSNLYIGSEEPTDDKTIVWIDTSDAEEGYTGNISDSIINEFREIFKATNEEIERLKDRVSYLEAYLGSGGEIPTTNNVIPVYGDNTILVTENDEIIIYSGSGSVEPIANNILPVYENNTVLVTEDNMAIIY